jgi:hypothetical protein
MAGKFRGRQLAARAVCWMWLIGIGQNAVAADPPSNDDFNSAKIIGAVPYSDSEDTTAATGASDDPYICSVGKTSNTVWYSYTPDSSGVYHFTTAGSNYYAALSLLTGSRGSLSEVACSFGYGPGAFSSVEVMLTGGTTYFIDVSGFLGGGQLSLTVERSTPTESPSLGNAVDNTALTWLTGGDAPWVSETATYYYDGDAAQSGSAGSGQASYIQTTVTGPGLLSFYWQASGYPYLYLYIDGVQVSSCLSTAWTNTIVPIPGGSHTVMWFFKGSSYGYSGLLDKVTVIPGPAILVRAPNGGEGWRSRDLKSITWLATDDVGSVRLELLKGNSLRYVITPSTPGISANTLSYNGVYSWWIPVGLEAGTDYKIRITSNSNPGGNGSSEGYFTITQCDECVGGFLMLPDSDAYASAASSPDLNLGGGAGGSFTIEGWFYETGWLRNGFLVSKSGSYEMIIERNNNMGDGKVRSCIGVNLTLASGQPWAYTVCKYPAIQVGWRHVAGVFDKDLAQVVVFLDGLQWAGPFSVGSSLVDSTQPLTLGPANFNPSSSGSAMDEVRISDIARYPGGDYLAQFSCDEYTRALWHFSERAGSMAFHDACGEDNVLIGLNMASSQGVLRTSSPHPDWDGDGRRDVAVWRPGTGIWYVLPSSVPGTYTGVQWGLPTDIPAIGDYDADGKTDMAVWRPETGVWYILQSSAPGTYTGTQWGLPDDIAIPGDYDGDGKADVAIWRPGTGAWYLLSSVRPGTYSTVQWGIPGDRPVPADYDGDGRTDIAIWRPGTGAWYILPSNSPGTYQGATWGSSTDVPLPRDYDGDGKVDIAVWRKATGVWYVLLSGIPGSYIATQWGISTDTPVPGDYDGDGKADISVWRGSTGVWYVLPGNAPGTYTAIQWGLSPDVPIE